MSSRSELLLEKFAEKIGIDLFHLMKTDCVLLLLMKFIIFRYLMPMTNI